MAPAGWPRLKACTDAGGGSRSEGRSDHCPLRSEGGRLDPAGGQVPISQAASAAAKGRCRALPGAILCRGRDPLLLLAAPDLGAIGSRRGGLPPLCDPAQPREHRVGLGANRGPGHERWTSLRLSGRGGDLLRLGCPPRSRQTLPQWLEAHFRTNPALVVLQSSPPSWRASGAGGGVGQVRALAWGTGTGDAHDGLAVRSP
jgi:hypothetical protein